jgi:hypothetical protein
MTIRQLIAYLLQDNDIDDEIIVAYWDRKYFVDQLDLHNELDPLWKEFVKTGQEKVNAYLDFTQTGYELVDDLEKLLEEKGKN